MRLVTSAVLVGLMLVLAAPAPGAVTCSSGAELYEQDGVRIFETQDREDLPVWWACSTRVRTPRRLVRLSPGVTNELSVDGTVGRRLLFSVESFADGGGSWDAGWFDVRSGRVARGLVDQASKLDFTAGPEGLHVNVRGDLAYVLSRQDAELEKEVARDVVYRPFADGRFGRERILAKLEPEEVEPATIRFADGRVTWREVGAQRRAPLEPAAPPPAAAAAARRRAPLGPAAPSSAPAAAAAAARCTQGRTLYDYGARVYTTGRGTFACYRSRVARISRRRVRPRAYLETDRYLAFAAAGRLFRFDLKTGRMRSGAVDGGVLKIAQSSGSTAAATAAGPIVLLPQDGPLREVVALRPEEIEPSTLRLTRTEVIWRERGAARSAAYPGRSVKRH